MALIYEQVIMIGKFGQFRELDYRTNNGTAMKLAAGLRPEPRNPRGLQDP